jgi:threonine/homoserine/homoserine lactone efflux protein
MYLIVGILLGFVAAIPLGPVNAFVISQTMKRDFLHGFLAGVTAAVLDTIYCLIALFGFSLVTLNIAKYQIPLKIIAGLVMLLIAWRLYLTSKKPVQPKLKKSTPSFSARPLLGVFSSMSPIPPCMRSGFGPQAGPPATAGSRKPVRALISSSPWPAARGAWSGIRF